GWLLPNFLAKAGMDVAMRLRKRVADELTTTFASHYTAELSLSEALQVENVAKYNAKTTGQKYLICPQNPI
ncbi:MAG: NADH oxidase, partial [Pseudomonadota bacterium]